MQPFIISRYSVVNCLGAGSRMVAEALRDNRSGLAPCDFETVALDTYIGRVPGLEVIKPHLAGYGKSYSGLSVDDVGPMRIFLSKKTVEGTVPRLYRPDA